MKLNRFFLTLCAVLNVCMAWGQQTPLRFNKDGKFKIVQLTDIHYKYDDQANSQVGIDCINKVLDAENPDCVIITGDGVVSIHQSDIRHSKRHLLCFQSRCGNLHYGSSTACLTGCLYLSYTV